MAKGNNKYGAAGRRAVPSKTAAAFFDHYIYYDEFGKMLNGHVVTHNQVRTFRRWRNTDTAVSESGLDRMLLATGFESAWFVKWCKLHRLPPQKDLTFESGSSIVSSRSKNTRQEVTR